MSRGFFGRDAERAEVFARVAEGERIVVLRGPPGVGKTTLAHVIAAQLGSEGRETRTVSLENARDRTEALAAIARATGVPARAADPRILLERIAARVDGRRMVLVLDALEHVALAVGELAADLVDVTTDTVILATSRERLGTPLEVTVVVAPLPLADATALLRDRTKRLAPTRNVEAALAEKLVLRAGRLPLAIELLAARVATLGAQQVLDGLAEGELEIDALDRALDASWNLLAESDRRALAVLGAFRGSFTLEAARAVLDVDKPVAALDALVAASLVDATESAHGARFAMLEGVRSYAMRQARSAALADAAQQRHCLYYARTSSARSDDAPSWSRLLLDRDDLLAAWEHARAHDAPAAARLAVTLDPVLVTQGPATLHRKVLDETLSAIAAEHSNAHEAPKELRAAEVDLELAVGRIDGLRGLHAAAIPHFEAALRASDAMNDAVRAGWSAGFLCFSLRPLGRFEEARAHGLRALREAHAARDPRLEAMAEQALGSVDLAAGDHDAALAAYRRALAAARIAGAPRLEGITLANLALAHRAKGELDEALRTNTESRVAFELAADRFHLARVAVDRGNIHVAAGALAEAEQELLLALDAVLEQGDLEGELDARTGLALAAAARGDPRLAQRRTDDLAAVARLTDDVLARARAAEVAASLASLGNKPVLTLRATHDGRVLEIGGRRHDLSRRGASRRLVVALVDRRLREPGVALTVADLLAAGWPGEKMRAESGAARVYMAIRRLRALALEAVLRTSDEGYSLDPDVAVEWLGEPVG